MAGKLICACGAPALAHGLVPKEPATDRAALKRAGIPVRIVDGVPMRMTMVGLCLSCFVERAVSAAATATGPKRENPE